MAIKINKPAERENDFKIPKYIIRDWDTKGYTEMLVKCGTCYECKQERARNWIYKIFLESLDYKEKCFITLTYKDDKNGKRQVSKKNLQNFIKRLRKEIEPQKIKYFAAGEYGEKKGRPHYHIIILGYQPKDLKILKGKNRSKKGHKMYDSEEIKKLWGHGRISIQRFNYKEIAYLSLYLNKNDKINKINYKEREKKKEIINEIKVKHGIMIKTLNQNYSIKNNNKRWKYTPIKLIKDLTKEELRNYKKEYNEEMKKINYNIVPEFNLFSKGMGFKNYIKKEYYKYDLIIDNLKFETPKDYLRKIIENKEKYQNHEVYQYALKESIERKEEAEKQLRLIMKGKEETLEDISDIKETIKLVRQEERSSETHNNNRKKLKKLLDSDF